MKTYTETDHQELSSRLQNLIRHYEPLLASLPEEEVGHKPNPEKWSSKEILGHLCDSAINNYHRFIRLQIEEEPFRVEKYVQDEWVRLAGYHQRNWLHIYQLWLGLNHAIAEVLQILKPASLSSVVQIGEEIRDFHFLIKDYLDHMEHHLLQFN